MGRARRWQRGGGGGQGRDWVPALFTFSGALTLWPLPSGREAFPGADTHLVCPGLPWFYCRMPCLAGNPSVPGKPRSPVLLGRPSQTEKDGTFHLKGATKPGSAAGRERCCPWLSSKRPRRQRTRLPLQRSRGGQPTCPRAPGSGGAEVHLQRPWPAWTAAPLCTVG